MVHNLIGGVMTCVGTGVGNGAKTLNSSWYTPYHVSHRTEIAGFMSILHGAMRFYNNVFAQPEIPSVMKKMEENAVSKEWDDIMKPVSGFRENAFKEAALQSV